MTAAAEACKDVGNGVHLVDTHYVRHRLAGSHLVVDDGRAAFFDTGPAPAVPRLLAALERLGVDREQVDVVFLTHVHLDHAGGAGQLMQALPNARAILHPRGAPHMIDPTRLIEGSIAVYGEVLYRQLYGELLPVPAGRVTVAAEGDRFTVGRRRFEVVDTPGHARHHHCAVDLDHGDVYAGDTFGISYREFDTAAGAFVLPTTTPVQFDPEALHASIDKLMAYAPQRMMLMHFGPVDGLGRLAGDLHADIDEFVRIARRHAAAPERERRIGEDMFRHLCARLDRHGYTGDEATRRELLDDDVRLNSQGLGVWLGKR